MTNRRTLPLFDPNSHPQTWSERMSPGEFAVLYSSQPIEEHPTETQLATPICTVFSTLTEAESHAAAQIALHSVLRCRIYTHEGLGSPPIREISGPDFRDSSGLSASFRRWTGSILFFGGLALFIVDWLSDFRLIWPGVIGVRAFPAGLILLLTEFVILYAARCHAARP